MNSSTYIFEEISPHIEKSYTVLRIKKPYYWL